MTVAGLGLSVSPFALAEFGDARFGPWQSLLASTLTNVGTTLLLAALLFGVERGFLKRVSDAVTRTATEIVATETQGLRDAATALSLRMDALQAAVDEQLAEDASIRRDTVDRLSDDVSYATVTRALEQANDLGALWGGRITVPGGPQHDAPPFTFSWEPQRLSDGARTYEVPVLEIRYRALRNPSGGIGIPIVSIEWEPDESAADLLVNLKTAMIASGFGAEAKTLDGGHLFQMLQLGIREAIDGRREDDGSWVRGALAEMISPDVAITDQGICRRNIGVVLKADQFPPNDPMVLMAQGRTRLSEPEPPSAPVGFDSETWDVAWRRAAKRLPIGPTQAIQSGFGPSPYTSDTSPNR